MTVTLAQSREALAIRCCVCGAAPALRCSGLAGPIGHAARWHELASRDKPQPDAPCIDFRSAGRPGSDLTIVYRDGAPLTVFVRRALVDLAARHGLVVLAGASGRGTYAVTPRGLAWRLRVDSRRQPRHIQQDVSRREDCPSSRPAAAGVPGRGGRRDRGGLDLVAQGSLQVRRIGGAEGVAARGDRPDTHHRADYIVPLGANRVHAARRGRAAGRGDADAFRAIHRAGGPAGLHGG